MNNALITGIELSYLLAAILFIIGLKQLSSPATARQGNFLAAIGMLIAVIATLINQEILSYGLIAVALVIGSIIGLVSAQKVPMTAMPQMVAIFNGLGGAASALIAMGEYWRLLQSGENIAFDSILIAILGILIGGVTFTGSVLAFAKLQELISGAPVTFPFQQPFNILLLLTFLGGSIYLFFDPTSIDVFLTLVGLSLIFGALFVLPIGGGDMPVVISLLNSFSGLAASVVGFILMNSMLIIAGALVGASGIILTQIMCKAMNRSLASVLFGALGTGASAGGEASATSSLDKSVHAIDSEEGAMMLGYARSVVIVPGYGMAVAQAQHAVRELAEQLEKNGVEVKYAIHPVAGRMPGHMNVLLAEATVPYPQLYDMDDINLEFERVDV
ncbi:MAG: NAD(P)(+) transhydrogenase (Re/Si-specific) subunit beta, partial [Microcystis sp.]